VKSVAVSKDGKRVASGGKDETVRVWDAQTGKELKVFSGHFGYVTTFSYCFFFTNVWCVLTIEHFTGTSRVFASAHMASRLPVAARTKASRFGTQTPATVCRR
jgi:WD40 repeat protein